MILQTVTLHNFGVYAGQQVIALAPVRDRPITLIGALNGGGKTTILEAVQIALYGRTAKCIDRRRGGYNEYLKQAINRSSVHNSAAVSIEFSYRTHGHEDQFKVTRTWSLRGTQVDESVVVDRNGVFDQTITERWAEFIEALIPSQISDLFFFDGEKIESLADPERSAELLRIGIHSLLGLDLVDDLSKSLSVMDRKLRADAITDADRHQLDQMTAQVRVVEETLELESHQLAATQVLIDTAHRDFERTRERFKSEGGELFEQRQSLHIEREAAARTLDGFHSRLRDLANGLAPLLLIKRELKTLEEQAKLEEEAAVAREVVRYLGERDTFVLGEMKRGGMPQKWLGSLDQLLEETKDAIVHDAGAESFLGVPSASIVSVQSSLADVRKTVRGSLKDCAEASQRLDMVERRIAAIPDEAKLGQLLNELRMLESRQHELRTELKVRQENKDRLAQQYENKQKQLIEFESTLVEVKFKDRLTGEMKNRLADSKRALGEFRRRISQKHVGRLGSLIGECFQRLLRKQNFVDRVEIDPETFALTIRATSGSSIPSERLSAGERQLLAISVLWALARASGRRLPTIIDTPLGRLDSLHRNFLVHNYFPWASHQVVLLSTDEEIIGQYHAALKPSLAREYLIQYDDAKRASYITEGYFPTLSEAA